MNDIYLYLGTLSLLTSCSEYCDIKVNNNSLLLGIYQIYLSTF